jgi:saccharopine dehydrogenase-like NADP-dependent oxidoreductase
MSKDLNCFVMGAGVVGPAAARRLLRFPDVCHITIADADYHRAQEAVRWLGDPRCTATRLDYLWGSDTRNIIAAFAGADVVISAVPAAYSPSLAPLALEAGAGFCDFGGVTRVSRSMHDDPVLAEMAWRIGRSIVTDCGWAPGVSGKFTASLARRLPGARSIIMYVGGLGQLARRESFYWQRTFSARGLVELLTPATVLRDGVIRDLPPCSEGVSMHFPELAQFSPFGNGFVETRITAGAGLTPEIMQKLGVQDCWEETIRWDWNAFLAFIATVPEEDRVRVLEERLPHTSAEFKDIGVMRVIAMADDGATASYNMLVMYDTALRMSAMAKATGYSGAVVAHLVAQRATPPGVLVPEELDPDINQALITALSDDLNITYHETAA